MTLKKLLKGLKEEFKVGVRDTGRNSETGWHKIYRIESEKDVPEMDMVSDKNGHGLRFIAYGPGKDLYVFSINLLHEDAADKLKINIYHGTEPVVAGIAEKKNGKWFCRSSFNFEDAIYTLTMGGHSRISEAKEKGLRSGVYLDAVMKFDWSWADKFISITPKLNEVLVREDVKK